MPRNTRMQNKWFHYKQGLSVPLKELPENDELMERIREAFFAGAQAMLEDFQNGDVYV